MDNADILDTDLLHCQDRGDSSDSSGLISNIQIQDICFLKKTIVHNINGIPVISGVSKHLIQTLSILVIHKTADLYQQTDIVIQNIGNILVILYTDLFPHDRRGGCDTGDIPETSCCDGFHIFLFIVQHIYKINKCGGDDMRQMTDSSSDKIMFLTCKDHGDGSERGDHFSKVSQSL